MPSQAAQILRHPSHDRILDEAEALFASRGYSGTGLSELAERAGLSKSTLFHHFPSKTEIYAAVMERLFASLLGRVEERLDTTAGPLERIETIVDLWTGFVVEHQGRATLFLRGLVEREFEDEGLTREYMMKRHGVYVLRLIQIVTSTVDEGIAKGLFRPQPAAHFLQTLIGATLFHFASGPFGQDLIGGDIFSDRNVEARKREMKDFVRAGLLKK